MNRKKEKKICDVCLKPIKASDTVVKVQAIEDDNGNEIKNAPIHYFHRECVSKDYVQ